MSSSRRRQGQTNTLPQPNPLSTSSFESLLDNSLGDTNRPDTSPKDFQPTDSSPVENPAADIPMERDLALEDMANLNPTFASLKIEDPEEYTKTIELQRGSKPELTQETHYRVTFRTGL